MKILEYSDLDTSGVEAQYRKVIAQLERDDLYSAEVKNSRPATTTAPGWITATV